MQWMPNKYIYSSDQRVSNSINRS